jgi:uncharacterized protein YndB with AHSA1/START domain
MSASPVVTATVALTLGLALAMRAAPSDRAVVVEATVDASPAEIFRLWTTADGTKRFFAPDARINARVGGRYEIIFNPAEDPEGARAGTKGATILRFEPDRRLDFQWSVGVPGVSWDLKASDFQTWVELTLAEAPGDPGRTRVRLVHRGFQSGGSWDAAYDYFGKAWTVVLQRLAANTRDGTTPW